MNIWHILRRTKLPRAVRFLIQRITQGFPDSDTWDLDRPMAKFIAPRLKRFKELNNGWPSADFPEPEDWNKAIDKMIYSMEALIHDTLEGNDWEWIAEEQNKIQEGLELFGKHFTALWW